MSARCGSATKEQHSLQLLKQKASVLSSAVLELSEEIGNHFCVDNKTRLLLSKLLHEFCIIESS